MKVCLALLLDYKIQNYARKIAFDIDKIYKTGFIAAKLPQHVTLGPLFEVEEPKCIEDYFDALARKLNPFEIMLTKIDLKTFGDDNDGFGILWIDVEESKDLRELHERIYNEIEKRSWKVDSVSNDGMYKFHSTIALGQQPTSVYKEVYNNIQDRELNYTCIVKEIALFCPSDNENKMGTYITYKKLPLGVKE